MKRFAIAAMILVSLLACTKSNIQYEPTGEISLQPVAEKSTKAAYTATVYGEGAPAFNVWAWWADAKPGEVTDMNAYLTSNDVTPYISIIEEAAAGAAVRHISGLREARLSLPDILHP